MNKEMKDLIDKIKNIDIKHDKKIKELQAKSAAIDAKLNRQLEALEKRIKS